MRLNQPKQVTWWISLILAVLGILGKWVLTSVAFLSSYAFILLLVGFALLWLATFVKGL
ncbi:MAG: hypothetical protein GXO74_14155 [Calditrichaeota bacterium]|nr:hypothetical protein [Calditrichota bacterium]